jgi:AcrR family transcriptional regulator
MKTRAPRAEKNERTRSELLAAARSTFERHGYHGASLDQIAEEAGYTKGAVYSRFGSKADLFLALLEARHQERLAHLSAALDPSTAQGLVAAIVQTVARLDHDKDWYLVRSEFRAHAHRDPVLNERYAALHESVVGAVTELIDQLFTELDVAPPVPASSIASFFFAIETGIALERAANPSALPAEDQVALVLRSVFGTSDLEAAAP